MCRIPWLFAARRTELAAPPPGELDEQEDELDENPLDDMLWEPEGLREYADHEEDYATLEVYTEDRRGRQPEDEDEIPMYVRAFSLSY
jgi:hypothetical protein